MPAVTPSPTPRLSHFPEDQGFGRGWLLGPSKVQNLGELTRIGLCICSLYTHHQVAGSMEIRLALMDLSALLAPPWEPPCHVAFNCTQPFQVPAFSGTVHTESGAWG